MQLTQHSGRTNPNLAYRTKEYLRRMSVIHFPFINCIYHIDKDWNIKLRFGKILAVDLNCLIFHKLKFILHLKVFFTTRPQRLCHNFPSV